MGAQSSAEHSDAPFVAGPRLWLDLAVWLGWTASASEAVATTLRTFVESPLGGAESHECFGYLPSEVERIVATLERVAPQCYRPFAPAIAAPVSASVARESLRTYTRPMLNVVTGFLGSGKTTLVSALVAEPSRGPTLLIVNELGEAPVDDRLVLALGVPVEVVAFAGGCLCCSVGDDLVDGLVRLLAAREAGSIPPFAHVLIETSGGADPGPLVERLLEDRLLRERVDFRGVVTTVDATSFEDDYAAINDFALQLAAANYVVVTKADLLDVDARGPVMHAIRKAAPGAEVLVPTRTADAAAKLVQAWNAEAPRARSRSVEAGDVRHDDQRGVVSIRAGAVSTIGLRLFCDLMMLVKGHELYRMKGEVELVESGVRCFIQGVRSRVHAFVPRSGARPGTRLTLIGRRIQSAPVRALFERLALPPIRSRSLALTREPSVAAPTEK